MKLLNQVIQSLCLIFLTACSGNFEKKILGQWEEIEKPESKVEFYDDGTLIAFNESSPLRIKGKWKFLEDGRLKTEMSMMGIQSVDTYTVIFEGEAMTTVDGDDLTKFTRSEGH